MSMENPRKLRRELWIALVPAAAAAGLRAGLTPAWGTSFPYGPFYTAILISCAVAGWRSGTVSAVAGGLMGFFIFGPDERALFLLLRYAAVAAAIILFCEIYHRLRARSRALQREAEQRHWMRATLSSLTEPILVTDNSDLITLMNTAAERLTGWLASEAEGRHILEVAPLEGGTLRLRNGSELAVEVSRMELARTGDRPPGWMYTVHDVTAAKLARQALAESEERLRLALSAARMGVWTNEVCEGRVIWSPELEEIAGIPRGSFGGTEQAFFDIVHAEDREAVAAEIARAIEERREYEVVFRFRRSDGEIRWMEGRGRAFYNDAGRLIRLAGTAMDITEHKRLEEELRVQAQELMRSNHDLEQFAYIASHDLQEPLRTVGLYAQMLNERFRGKVDLAADQYIDFVVGAVRRMQAQIKGLMEYSRAGRRKLPARPVAIEKALDRAIANLGGLISESGARVTRGELPEIVADENEVVLLLQNLLSNAIRYRSADIPEIRISAASDNGDWLFSVKDNGVGIDPRYNRQIFDIFKRLHGSDIEGTGIGLAICKRVVEGLGGRIWVESQPSKGADFRFTIPQRRAAAAAGGT